MSSLDETIKKHLLTIARSAITTELFGADEWAPRESAPPRRGPADTADLRPDPDLPGSGVFVTLRKFGHLRGCIGTFTPRGSLVDTIRIMAASAAHDPRFIQKPIGATEMRDITIEISVLSPLEPIADPLHLELGVHGIYIRRGHESGCFLPDVAGERGWDVRTFLSQCCDQKAGLEPDAWRKPDTEVFVFTVEKFCDPSC